MCSSDLHSQSDAHQLSQPHISTTPLPSVNMHSSGIDVLNVFSDNKTKIWDSILRVLENNLFTYYKVSTSPWLYFFETGLLMAAQHSILWM